MGTHDGAKAVQEPDDHLGHAGIGPKGAFEVKAEKVGRVRFEHFATSTVIDGEAEKGDIVELEEKAEPPKELVTAGRRLSARQRR